METKQRKKPVIGILPMYYDEKESIWMRPTYTKAIQTAGGIPFILPFTTDREELSALADMADGLLFPGGHDINPALYAQQQQEFCGEPNALRDDMEAILFPMALEQNKPMLGICRGLQIFNVLCGGTLYQDLAAQHDSEIVHNRPKPYSDIAHSVTVNPESRLHEIVKMDELSVNSLHHQSICQLSDLFCSAALSPDGLIEAIEMPEKPFVMAVQWHPEFLFEQDTPNLRIFEAFVKACQL